MLCVLTFGCFRLNDHINCFLAWMVKQLGGPLLINLCFVGSLEWLNIELTVSGLSYYLSKY